MLRLRPSRQRRWLVGGVLVALLAVLTGVFASSRGGGPSFRTASVERADVDATLDSLGTVQPINQANLSFPIAGNVGSVSAAVGQQVIVGQTLAQLDTTALDAQVASAQSSVAAARARLAADGSSQTSGTATIAVAPAAFITEITRPSDPTPAARDLVTVQQAHLIADQHRADLNLATEQHDLKSETDLCQSPLSAADGGAAGSSPQLAKRGSLSSAAGRTALSTGKSLNAGGCQSVLQAVLADQIAVEHDQQAVFTDLPALNDAVDKLVASARTSAQPQPIQAASAPRTTASTGSSASGASRAIRSPASDTSASARATGSPAGAAPRAAAPRQPASAEQLASDQAAIDAANAQLAEAQQSHDQAELRSPINGTVGSVTISAGQSVQGSSGTPQIIIIGPGSHQVTTSVSDTNVRSVHVGDAANITPSGSPTSLPGQVVSIGLLATSGSVTSSGSASYPVTIGLTSTAQQLFAGQSAAVSIMLAQVSGALTVPSSAVHTAGANHIVTVLRNGSTSSVRVTVGAVGTTRTQVLIGLNSGDQVVLADLSQPLPGTTVANVSRLASGGGATGGAGGGGGRRGG
jgi:RND family efflux transporter MFP subunit